MSCLFLQTVSKRIVGYISQSEMFGHLWQWSKVVEHIWKSRYMYMYYEDENLMYLTQEKLAGILCIYKCICWDLASGGSRGGVPASPPLPPWSPKQENTHLHFEYPWFHHCLHCHKSSIIVTVEQWSDINLPQQFGWWILTLHPKCLLMCCQVHLQFHSFDHYRQMSTALQYWRWNIKLKIVNIRK